MVGIVRPAVDVPYSVLEKVSLACCQGRTSSELGVCGERTILTLKVNVDRVCVIVPE